MLKAITAALCCAVAAGFTYVSVLEPVFTRTECRFASAIFRAARKLPPPNPCGIGDSRRQLTQSAREIRRKGAFRACGYRFSAATATDGTTYDFERDWGTRVPPAIPDTPLTDDFWVGSYRYGEISDSPNYGGLFPWWDCVIRVFNDNGEYIAEIERVGHMVWEHFYADVLGDGDGIKFLYRERIEGFSLWWERGDILLDFIIENNEMHTYWGKFDSVLEQNCEQGKVRFERVADNPATGDASFPWGIALCLSAAALAAVGLSGCRERLTRV